MALYIKAKLFTNSRSDLKILKFTTIKNEKFNVIIKVKMFVDGEGLFKIIKILLGVEVNKLIKKKFFK